MKHRICFCSASETGLVRKDNQDNIFISPSGDFFCVADGMGGGSDGALASAMVCEEIRSAVEKSPNDIIKVIDKAIKTANDRVRKHALDNGFRQMGTTVVLLGFNSPKGDKASVCHIGDSRVYRIRDSKAELLTADHTIGNQLLNMADESWAAKLRNRSNPLSHVLTRAVGTADETESEWQDVEVSVGDWYLLCSDGVHDVLDEEMIGKIFSSGDKPEDISVRLREEILRGGAPDNFSYIVIKVEGV